MLCASICHTDISGTKGFPHTNFPIALGHEGVGVIESVGDQVTNLKEGDVVIPTYIGECQECENCVSEETNLCVTYPVRWTGLQPDNTSRMSVRGQRLYHILSCSTWSEYMVSDANYVLKVEPTIDPIHASFISCGFSTGFGAAWKEAKVESGSIVAVFGLGAVGLGNNLICLCQFFLTSIHDDNDLVTCVGTGKAIVIGAGTEPILPLGLLAILLGRTLKGSIFGGLKATSDLSVIANKCHKKEFPLQELLTHEVPLADINKAFELLKQPNCVKVFMNMSH
uniref:Alcohol dehydrogenase-like 2 n=1 Tax=Cajanus cajan TaxID=3821 RepID=A0A151TM42_CAJCA|nr:Alcohol dehydrogenase-like 2 [Cajanus cajan]